jgi:predicted nucleic-acid-binding Zn-ribbon protein
MSQATIQCPRPECQHSWEVDLKELARPRISTIFRGDNTVKVKVTCPKCGYAFVLEIPKELLDE